MNALCNLAREYFAAETETIPTLSAQQKKAQPMRIPHQGKESKRLKGMITSYRRGSTVERKATVERATTIS